MEEDGKDSVRAPVTHQYQIDIKEARGHCAPIGELILHYLLRYPPPKEHTGKEASDGEKYLTGHKIEYLEKRFPAYGEKIPLAKRKRA